MEQTSEWNGLKRGDAVKIDGWRGSFHFEAYCRTDVGEWVSVYGGMQRKRWRSVTPDRVHRLDRKVSDDRSDRQRRGKPPTP